jgi:uncharacterized membrane protein
MRAMIALILPALVLAVVGSIAVLIIHVAALFGITWPFEHYLTFVGPGIFVVFVPTVLDEQTDSGLQTKRCMESSPARLPTMDEPDFLCLL